MTIDCISRGIIFVDKVIDYVPFVSVLNNGIVLVAKIALTLFRHVFPEVYAKIERNALVNHIMEQKSVLACVVLSIPYLNTVVAFVRDFCQAPDRASFEPAPAHVPYGPPTPPLALPEKAPVLPPEMQAVIDRGRRNIQEAQEQLLATQASMEETRRRDSGSVESMVAARVKKKNKVRSKLEEIEKEIAGIDKALEECDSSAAGQARRKDLKRKRKTLHEGKSLLLSQFSLENKALEMLQSSRLFIQGKGIYNIDDKCGDCDSNL